MLPCTFSRELARVLWYAGLSSAPRTRRIPSFSWQGILVVQQPSASFLLDAPLFDLAAMNRPVRLPSLHMSRVTPVLREMVLGRWELFPLTRPQKGKTQVLFQQFPVELLQSGQGLFGGFFPRAPGP